MEEIEVLELFGGIGACSMAFEELGIPYHIADYVEIDKYAVKSFNAIHGTNFEPQDICAWDKDIKVDLIMHGSPCQDFSLAGQGKGGDKDSGTRSSLMYETLRIVEKIKPKYVIWENVKNLLSKAHRHNFDSYLESMEGLGYTNYYQVLNAKDYGIPQNRERVFTVSIRKDIGKTFTFPQPKELDLRLKDMLEDNVDEKYYLSEEKIKKIANWKAFQKPFEKVQGKNSIAPTLTARGAGEEHSGMITYCEDLENTTNLQEECLHIKNNTKKGYLEAMEGDGVNISTRMEHQRGNVQKQSIQTLTTSGGNDRGVVVKEEDMCDNNPKVLGGVGEKKSNGGKQWYQQDRIYDNKVAMTVTSNCLPYYCVDGEEQLKVGLFDDTSSDNFAKGKRDYGYRDEYGTLKCNPKYSIYKSTDLRIRKLTPKECWRLMGFPDSSFEEAAKVNSDTQLYKQAGNSIVVPVLKSILTNLLLEEEE